MTRTPHSAEHDAMVSLQPTRVGFPRYAYALVKKSYAIRESELEPVQVRALEGDPRDPSVAPRLPRGSDYWWQKLRTDVVIEGSAWAPRGRPTDRTEVRCTVGSHTKRIAVFGDRQSEGTAGGNAIIGPPERFESIPLDDEHAYGGLDPRVPVSMPSNLGALLALSADHPGLYPRNPVGRGYWVLPSTPRSGLALPNLEDPDDLLDDDRIFVKDPRRWYLQPLPWTLGWQHAMALSRMAHLGAEAHFRVDDPALLKEVTRGFLPPDYRDRAAAVTTDSFHLGFFQEASLGLSFAELRRGTQIALDGLHPERRRILLEVPEPPQVEIAIAEHRERVSARLTAAVIEPDMLRASFVYLARTSSLPRTFIPGIHPEIPLSARVDGGTPVHYDTPPVRTHADA